MYAPVLLHVCARVWLGRVRACGVLVTIVSPPDLTVPAVPRSQMAILRRRTTRAIVDLIRQKMKDNEEEDEE